jgi:hypothetical protein
MHVYVRPSVLEFKLVNSKYLRRMSAGYASTGLVRVGSESRICVMESRQVGLVPGIRVQNTGGDAAQAGGGLVPGIRVQNTGDAVQACGAGTWDQSPEYG